MSTEIKTPDVEDGYPVCQSCGDTYDLHEGCEPSKYCDRCAQKIVEKVEIELITANQKINRFTQSQRTLEGLTP